MNDRPSPTGGGPLDRRDFLRLGAAGLAGSVAAARPPDAEAAGPPPSRPLAGIAPPPQDVPAVGDLVKPADLPAETWLEPFVWRPGDWPGQTLALNVVQHQNPGPSPSPGNPLPSLFSYGGTSPAPTIRARGDEAVGVTLRNMLDTNHQLTPVGPFPDVFDLTPADRVRICRMAGIEGEDDEAVDEACPGVLPFASPEETFQVVPARRVEGWKLVDHANGQRTAHATNIHTHGLHIPPDFNPDGSVSDNVLLRLIPRGDWALRRASTDPGLRTLRAHERVGSVDYSFLLGAARHGAPEGSPPRPHPPGTHWYHPHSHGSTHDQVASGMAGFFIVEGDVDDAVNRALTGEARPDSEAKTGPFDYRERLILIQRVFVGSVDLDTGPRRRQLRVPPPFAVNGVAPPAVLFMRPGAVERWRVLNGSVDGSGFKRFMVLRGQYVHRDARLWRVVEDAPPADEGTGETGAGGGGGRGQPRDRRRLVPVSRQEVEDAKLPLYLLAFDGITLVTTEGGRPRHTIEDLSLRNAGTQHPLARPPRPGEDPREALLRALEDCYRDGDSLRRCFNRPNEIYMANANRADVFFKAPLGAAGEVFTVFAQEVQVHTDNLQERLQSGLARDVDDFMNRDPFDVVVAYVHVRGDPVEGGDLDVPGLRDVLPEVPPFLHPVEESELRVPAGEAVRRGVAPGSLRTRVVSYSGWGGAHWPLVRVPQAFADAHPELEGLVWSHHDGVPVLLPNGTRTMGVNARFDLAVEPDPGAPRKFVPDEPDRPKVLLDTAEEWVLYNCSQTLWAWTDTERHPQRGQYGLHFESYPVSRAEGQARFARDRDFRMTTKGSDHPFHIHINPMWVLRIDVPDENGELHNVLPEPRWMDTVPIPRDGGRVVFRSRFLDFTGRWVHHCHILLHEDNGMMQVMECTDDAGRADYNPRRRVATHAMDAAEVDRIYPRPSRELMYRQNIGFVDASPGTGQVYPGFDVATPVLEDGE